MEALPVILARMKVKPQTWKGLAPSLSRGKNRPIPGHTIKQKGIE